MKTTLPTSHLHPITSSKNGSYHVVAAETVGKATIHSTLSDVMVSDFNQDTSLSGHICSYLIFYLLQRLPDGPLHKLTPVVSKDQALEIYRPIRLQPDRLVILWDPATEFHYQYQMEV